MRSVNLYFNPMVKVFINLGICLIGETSSSDSFFLKRLDFV